MLKIFFAVFLSTVLAKYDPLQEKARIMESIMDPNVKPCDDFWSFANGRLKYDLTRFYLTQARSALSRYNPKHEGTSLGSVKDQYKKCLKNPPQFLGNLQTEDGGQRAAVEAFIQRVRDGPNVTHEGTFTLLLQEGYKLLYQYGSRDFQGIIETWVIIDGIVLPYPTTPPIAWQQSVLNSSDPTHRPFLSEVFGEAPSSKWPVYIPYPSDAKTRNSLINDLSIAAWDTLRIPLYESCEMYIVNAFSIYYAKILADYLGSEYLSAVDKQLESDLVELLKSAETALRYGNALSQNMTDILLDRLKGNKFPRISHPIFSDELFYKFLGHVDATNLTVQRRWLNNLTPLMRAMGDREVVDLRVPEPDFNAAHSRKTQRTFVNFPIVTPTTFDPSYPPILRFSGLGAAAGHEFGHDLDEGLETDGIVEFDSTYRQVFDCIYNYYKDQCNPEQPWLCIDPKHDVNEAFADSFGVQMAYLAYKRSTATSGIVKRPSGTVLDGLTNDQLFFLNFAQVLAVAPNWARHNTPSDLHPPGPTRVWGALSGFPAFANAFNCPVGSNYRQPGGCSLYNIDLLPEYNITDNLMH
ncbi:unnamed protein product [Bursaphelenchus xylophilus]|uniref:(pine wood nematode) hypothetical protein n=1 Tax=Bursaphelenchus xylophilus TaxID=6326 RepID=A0A1I7RU96_BURXY|nr:unnamed protein product [Bursaphelenchus xylophilus]CAG9113956.1 unnamed protein product [Bursaphelenchus xylophilus]